MAAVAKLLDEVTWEAYAVGAGAAHGTVPLRVGTVGSGRPVALVAAGVHGDEGPWGSWAIHRLLDKIPVDCLRGTLRIVPAANPLALESDRRNAPLDGLDLNRSFPGNPHGSHTERLARVLYEHVVTGADVVVDLHGGGSWCQNAFVFAFAGAEELARAVGAPFVVDAGYRSLGQSSLTTAAQALGARVVAVEMGGRGAREAEWAERIAEGLLRVLVRSGVIESDGPPPPPSLRVAPPTVLRPSVGGLFCPVVGEAAVGTVVPQGTLLGTVRDPVSWSVLETFVAPFEETALLLVRPTLAVLEAGAMTYVVAHPAEQ
jgi:predicted deacylase